MDRGFAADNAAGLERLRTVLRGLTREQTALPIPGGWTVAGILGHLAFWDLRALQVAQRTAAQGPLPSPVDTDLVNEAMRPLMLALPPDDAVRICLSAAEGAAAAVAAASDELLAALGAPEVRFNPLRSRHWHMHLDEIEQALAAAARPGANAR